MRLPTSLRERATGKIVVDNRDVSLHRRRNCHSHQANFQRDETHFSNVWSKPARVSNERALEVRHTVLLNWDEHTRPMLRQLEAARREGRLRGTVVVLAERDKQEMDAEVRPTRAHTH